MPDSTEKLPSHAAPTASPRFPLGLILFGVVAVGSVGCGFLLPSVEQAGGLVRRFGYYAMVATFCWAVVAVARVASDCWKQRPRLSRNQLGALVGAIGGLTLLAVMTVPYSYKVLYDEFVLQATAWCLHDIREVGAIVRGYTVDGVFTTLLTYLDKRPYFYPFLVSLLHDFTGYREVNAFLLNTALFPVVLGLLYAFARRLASHAGAMAAVVAMGAFSLLAENANGAGMELLNLAMLLLVAQLAWYYLEAPDGRRLSALILSTVLLAQTRYESSLYVLPTALVVVEGWRHRGRMFWPPAAVGAPALLLPCALQNTYLAGTPMLWELRPGETTRFGTQYFSENVLHAWRFFFDFTGTLPNSIWLSLAGGAALLLAVVTLILRIGQWRGASPAVRVGGLFGAAVGANLGLLLFYYWGQLDDPIVSRLSLPFSVLLALCLAWAVDVLRVRWGRWVPRVAILGALVAYLSLGLKTNANRGGRNQLASECAWAVQAVEAMPPESRLIVTNKSSLAWLIHQISALQISDARKRVEQIAYHLARHTFAEVLVVQNYLPVGEDGGFQLDPADRLPESIHLVPLLERRFGAYIVRISRVTSIDLIDGAIDLPLDAQGT